MSLFYAVQLPKGIMPSRLFDEASYAHQFYDLEFEMFLHFRELIGFSPINFQNSRQLKLKLTFLRNYFDAWEKSLCTGDRFRLHVVIPHQLDFADLDARNQIEILLSRIRNTTMVSNNVGVLEENWMDTFQKWSGDDW